MSPRMLRFPENANQDDWSGERFIVGRTGDIEFEHYHRYLFATQFCAGRDVLDIACGEGYGSFLMSQVAQHVTGVDVAAEVVATAQRKYGSDSLAFRHGSCQAIGLPDASVDVAVSFETIEHIVEHDAFMAELRRVLRPGGLLIVSTPDRVVYSPPDKTPNPYHLRELTLPEFTALISANFQHHAMGLQKASAGSLLLPLTPGRDVLEVFHRHDERSFEAAPTPLKAPYLVALASDAPLPDIRWGVLDDAMFLYRLQHRIMQAEEHLDALGRLDQEAKRVDAVHAATLAATLASEREVAAERERMLASQIAEQEARLQAIWNSSSWRMMRPFRVLKRMLLGGPEGRAELRAQMARSEVGAQPPSKAQPASGSESDRPAAGPADRHE